ncbi:hypothetical protein [Filimonas effusa]|uniref:Glycosyltransferase RgtA/B/C/D-like domain-containing protein n=1 Tax=Filimonas effusa TaxID=2508721 RepID=A0A4Q1D5U8_9BACT|nr:hypothetical protein [Filimonas effusa]RXK83051.1 hypothetical protein ESB13_13070 [Filimonas effusa]
MLSILLHLPFFMHPPQVVPANGNGALSPFLFALPELPDVIVMVLYHVIVLLQAFRLNYMLNELRMLQKQALTTAMCYVLFTSLFEQWNHITPALLCNSLIIWLFHKMTQLKSSSQSRSIIYNIGFIAGTAVLLYHPSMTIILVCFVAIAILRPFQLNEWFILLIGILTPFYFLLFVLFLRNDLNSIWLYIPEWGTPFRLPPDLRPVVATLIALAVVLLAGIYSWRANASRMLIQVRKEWAVLLFMLLALIPAMFISKDAGYEAGLLSMVPGAALASHIFLNPRRTWLPNIFFWTLAALSIYNNWK